ncbi:MAG: ABC transporter substrate-binding protein [Pseudomonadota bacterium]
MRTVAIPFAYMPLIDAAPVIIAEEMGFAASEGISLDLIPAPSWSSVRDMLAFGRVDAAHMLSPVPVAMAMGLGGVTTPVSAVSVLSVNGNVLGVGRELETRLREIGFDFDFADPIKAADALASVRQDKLIFGVPFPFSMHVELLRYWCEHTAIGARDVEIRTVPPPLMADALAAGDVDAFCVGEPWGSVAVDQGSGALLLPGNAIWGFAPEKVMAVRSDWADTEPDLLGRLMRAVWRAGRWLAKPESRGTAGEILSRKAFLDVSAELVDRALTGHLTVTGHGDMRTVENFLCFHNGGASFPWRSQAKWIASRLKAAHDIGADVDLDQVAQVFRADLYRTHLTATSADLPGASEKLEGAIRHPTAVASTKGRLSLWPDAFFDGAIFDPTEV